MSPSKNIEKSNPTSKVNYRIIAGLLCLSMAGWIFGSDVGTIAGLIQTNTFVSRFGDSASGFGNTRQGLTVGSVNIGCFVSCLLSSPLADRFGKKISVLFWTGVLTVGLALEISAHGWQQVVVARVVKGFGIGSLSVIVPSYQSETSPPAWRGAIVTTYQLFLTFGILVAYLVTLGTHSMASDSAWQIPIGVNFLWPVLLFLGTLTVPESSRQLIKFGKVEAARTCIANIMNTTTDDAAVTADLTKFEADVEAEQTGGKVSWSECFAPNVRTRTFLGMALMALQVLSGANYFFFFGARLFDGVGVSDPYIAQVILGSINFGCTLLAPWLLERFGRRRPLIVGGLWMAFCFVCFTVIGGTAYQDPAQKHAAGIGMLVLAALFILGFATTVAAAAWVIVGESFPLRVRSKCSAIATSCNWACNFGLTFATGYATAAIGFWYGLVFCAFCLLLAGVTFAFAKETKGLTVDEIDVMYGDGSIKAWNSVAYARGIANARAAALSRTRSQLVLSETSTPDEEFSLEGKDAAYFTITRPAPAFTDSTAGSSSSDSRRSSFVFTRIA